MSVLPGAEPPLIVIDDLRPDEMDAVDQAACCLLADCLAYCSTHPEGDGA